MKLLLVINSDSTFKKVARFIQALDFDLIHYRHVLKAMDNIDEADPAGFIISAREFPRHWKILTQFIRSGRPREKYPIILLKGDNFSIEETSKAYYLGISGIVPEALDNAMDVDRLQAILSRYIPVQEKRKARRFHAGEWGRFGFLLSHPKSLSIITGEVKNISRTGIAFRPDNPILLEDFGEGAEFERCSLRGGDHIFSPSCRIVRTGRTISLEFLSFPPDEQALLESYLEALPLKDLVRKQREIESGLLPSA